MLSPAFDKDLCLPETVKDLSVQELISELSIEAFIVIIFPMAAVYCSLDWLIDVGLAMKIESVSKYIAKTAFDEMEQLALLLCDKCGHAEPFDAGPALQSLGAAAKSKGFKGHHTVIEIIGSCADHK